MIVHPAERIKTYELTTLVSTRAVATPDGLRNAITYLRDKCAACAGDAAREIDPDAPVTITVDDAIDRRPAKRRFPDMEYWRIRATVEFHSYVRP